MSPDPRALKGFLALCREGSISGAARHLSIAQPSLSVALSQLERSLGGPLFTRGRRGIALTAAGVALKQRAEMMERLLDDAVEAVSLAQKGVSGPLRIGGTPGALVSLVPSAIRALEGEGPAAVHIVERSDAQLTEMLRRGEIELAIVTTGVEVPPDDIRELSIARDPFALIVGRAHASLGPTVTLKDVVAFRWVLPRVAGAFHRQIEAMFLAAELPFPSDVIRCDSLLTSKEIIRQGDRVTVLPRGVVAPELGMGVLRAVPIAGAELNRSIGLRMCVGRALSKLAERFRTALVSAHQR